MYSSQVLQHFQHPRNSGEIEAADALVEVQNPACGDILRLSARVSDGCIADIRFRARGCVAAIACGSALTELVAGRAVSDARKITRADLLAEVGELPSASEHASHLAMDALAALLKKL
jgi:nitrogen fixation protein NifU and related proteins